MSDQTDFQRESQERLDAWRSEIRTFCDLARGEVDRIQNDLDEAERLAAEARVTHEAPVKTTPSVNAPTPPAAESKDSTYSPRPSGFSAGRSLPDATRGGETRPSTTPTPSHDASLDRLANLKRQLAEKLSNANQVEESEADDYS